MIEDTTTTRGGKPPPLRVTVPLLIAAIILAALTAHFTVPDIRAAFHSSPPATTEAVVKSGVEQQVQTMAAVTNAAIVVAVDYLQEIDATLERQSISVENDLAFIPHVLHQGKTCTLVLSRLPQLAPPPTEPGWQVKTLDCSTPQRPHD